MNNDINIMTETIIVIALAISYGLIFISMRNLVKAQDNEYWYKYSTIPLSKIWRDGYGNNGSCLCVFRLFVNLSCNLWKRLTLVILFGIIKTY